MRALLLSLALVTAPAAAWEVTSIPAPNGRVVVLTDVACVLPIPPAERDMAKTAILKSSDGTALFTGCWIRQAPIVHILWSDGDTSAVPDAVFKGAFSTMRWSEV